MSNTSNRDCAPQTQGASALRDLRVFLRRKKASAHLAAKFGYEVPVATFATMATRGGGPPITYFGRVPLYEVTELESWFLARLSPQVNNTTELSKLKEAA